MIKFLGPRTALVAVVPAVMKIQLLVCKAKVFTAKN